MGGRFKVWTWGKLTNFGFTHYPTSTNYPTSTKLRQNIGSLHSLAAAAMQTNTYVQLKGYYFAIKP